MESAVKTMREAMLLLDTQDTLRRLSDDQLDLLANLTTMLTPVAQREVAVCRRGRNLERKVMPMSDR